MPATCVIYNPAAGRGRAEAVLKELRPTLGSDVELCPTSHPGQAVDLARDAAARGFMKIIAAGGDGTVRDVVFSVWPMGSANDYAFTLGMAEWWKRRGESLPTEVLDVDVGRVTGGGRASYFVDALGVGFNGMVTIEARKIRWLRGMPLYALAFLKAMAKHFTKPRMRLQFDEREVETPTLALSVLLGQREGGFPLRPAARLTDGLFDYMHATRLSRGHLIRYLPAMMTGHLPEKHPLLKLGTASRIEVSSEVPLCVHTDGEFFCLPEDCIEHIEVEVIPARLRVEVFREGLYGRLRA
jgi:diacylglycerol kinase family enzyme